MKGKILVAGGTGFTGKFVCQELLSRNLNFDCLVRASTDLTYLQKLGIESVVADLNDPNTLPELFSHYQVLVNVASIGFGAAPGIVKACEQSGIKRAIFVSTTAIFTQLNAKSKALRLAAEKAIEKSELDYTILRPTMIYGDAGDRNMIRLLKFLKKSPILPVFGDGKSLQQPVCVQDVAWAIVEVIDRPQTYRKAYNISGRDALSYNEVIQIASQCLNRNPIVVRIPQQVPLTLLKLAAVLRIKTPITAEQVLRLNENKAFDYLAAAKDFNYAPRSFAEGISAEASTAID